MKQKETDVFDSPWYHVTNRCHNKTYFAVPTEQAWIILSDMLYFTRHAFDLEIINLTMMSNHYHMLVRAPHGNLSEAMRYFAREFTRHVNNESGAINQLWGSRYKRCQINSDHHLMNVYKYIYQNPVRAGIVERVEEYPYSTLRGLIGLDRMAIPVVDSIVDFEDLDGFLRWLNTLPSQLCADSMRTALRKKVFQLPNVNSRTNSLEVERL